MSSIADPSSHTFSSFANHSKQPPAISTKLRRIQDVADSPLASGAATPVSATPVLTTAPTTAPPTPIVQLSSGATDVREPSQERAGSVVNGFAQDANGTGEAKLVEQTARGPKDSVAADLDSVKTGTIALSKKHKRSAEEEEVMVQTAVRFAARLAEDHRAALFPDVDEPFTDEVDVVKRLLPYHVFQQPKEDLDSLLRNGIPHPSRKGKRKATEEELLREEIADTKFAIECWKRRRALEHRYRKARIETGKRVSPDDQGYVLAQATLEVERAENAALNAELRSARAELDKLEREKRAAAPAPSTPSVSTPRPTPTIRTVASSNYYSSPTTSTPTTATFMPPYRPSYSYSYSQYPTTQYSYNPHAYSSYTPTTSTAYGSAVPQTPATPSASYQPPSSATGMTSPTSAASAQVVQAQAQAFAASNTAIPVQLPVSSLPALAALGIVPVASSSLPPAGQSQPPAVIKTTNGTMLSLEINLSLLQSAQMSGLVLILNALTSRGVNVDGSGGASSTSAGLSGGSSGSANSSNGAATTTSVGSTAGSTASNAPAASTSTSVSASTVPTTATPSSGS